MLFDEDTHWPTGSRERALLYAFYETSHSSNRCVSVKLPHATAGPVAQVRKSLRREHSWRHLQPPMYRSPEPVGGIAQGIILEVECP